MSSIQVGSHAPHFTLFDSDKQPHTVPEHGVITVLAFFPGAFTGVCTKEACALRDGLAEFNALGARLYGISIDSPFVLAEFKKQNALTFPLLSDHKKAAIHAYDILFPNLANVGYETAKRSVFVVGANGHVAWQWISENPGVEPDYAAVKQAVAAAKG